MTGRDADSLIKDLENKKNKLEQEAAVISHDLKTQKQNLEESSVRVMEIVGSTDLADVESYLSNLENEISTDIEKLNEME